MLKNKGFSLIELLISISIIAILMSIVLTSLSSSRAKGYDSKIKQQLNSFRTSAEVYFTNQMPNSYGPATSACATGIFNDVDAVDGSPGLYIAPGNLPGFSQVTCDSSDSAYAVKATLYSNIDYWCVDSKGASRQITGTPDTNTFCP